MVDASLFVAVGLALGVALGVGELAARAGEPVVLGELVAGLILGPALLGIVDPDTEIALLAAIGSILLLFDTGYQDIEVRDFARSLRSIGALVVCGVCLPAASGIAVGLAFGYDLAASAVLAIALGVTSIGISARLMLDFDLLTKPAGIDIVGTAVSSEISGLVGFSLLMAADRAGAIPAESLRIVGPVIGFFVGGYLTGRFLIGRLSAALARFKQPGADLLGIMALVFLTAAVAAAVGLDVVIGGLVAGLLVSGEQRLKDAEIRDGIVGIAYGVFIPLFFVTVGARLDPRAVFQLDPFVWTVLAVALGTKFVGGALGARLVGQSVDDAVTVGIGLLPRAGVELVVVTSAREAGIIDDRLFGAVLLVVFVSVLAAPLLLGRKHSRPTTNAHGG